MYGIYNTVAKKFQFGICEETKNRARRALYKKIGKDSYKWRFEERKLPKDHEYKNRGNNAMPKIKSIKVGFGVSVAKGPGNWLKSSAEMEIEFENGDENMKDEIWKNAWDRVTEECGNQLKRLDTETP